MKTRRARSKASSVPVILGVWCTVFAAYGHIACDGNNNGGVDPDGGGVEPDAGGGDPDGGAAVDAPEDVAADVVADAPAANVGDFADSPGTYTWEAGGSCAMAGQTTVTITGDEIVVNPVGTNGAVPFALKQGTTNEAVSKSTNLNILDAPGHTCTLTRNAGSTDLAFACTNTSGGSCTDTAKKN